MTAKSAFWRARLQSSQGELQLELASPWRKAARTQFSAPLNPGSVDFHKHGWQLFGKYLAYVIEQTKGTHWNPVAYHLYGACEATSTAIDAWAVGISVAVEAVVGLVDVPGDEERKMRLAAFQARMRQCLIAQTEFEDMAPRMDDLIGSMGQKRPQDTLYALAATGHVDKNYVDNWKYLRNRHVHPRLKDLRKPTPADYQKLLDRIRCVEVLLHQLTFYIIGYEGPFIDYGVHSAQGFPSKPYPLENTSVT